MQSKILIKKIESLPPEAIAEIADFVEFVSFKTRRQNGGTRDAAITAYVAEHAGSEADLDEELERAGIEFLLEEDAR